MTRRIVRNSLADYKKDPDFELWYCHMEDKWLQNANWEEKLIALFGSVENAIRRYETYLTKEGNYLAN
jgi:hypothetical protein